MFKEKNEITTKSDLKSDTTDKADTQLKQLTILNTDKQQLKKTAEEKKKKKQKIKIKLFY